MRVAFIVTQFPCASETFILGQIHGLVERGHRVDVYADFHGDKDPAAGPLPIVTRRPARATRWTSMAPRLARRSMSEPALALGMLAASRWGRSDALAALRYAAAADYRTEHYDIVHCHFGPNGVKGAAMRDARAIAGKLVVTFHGYDLSLFLRQAGRHAYDRLFKVVDLCMPVSDYWSDRLIDLGCEPGLVQVHRMGVDCEMLGFLSRTGEVPTPRIVTTARLVEKKGVEYGIRAAAQALTERPLSYTIVGDGPDRPRLQSLIENLGVAEHVRIVGWSDHRSIRDILYSAEIVMLPSVTSAAGDMEGIPVSLMEAMATGLPSLSTTHSGIPELIRDGVEGFLVPERDSALLAGRLGLLLDSPQLRAEMGVRARNRVETQYNIRVQNDRLIDSYRTVINAQSVRC